MNRIVFVLASMKLVAQPTGECIVLDGNTDYYDIVDNSSQDINGDFTYELWLNPCDTSGMRCPITKLWCGINNFSYYLMIDGGVLRWAWDSDGNCGNGVGSYDSDNPMVVPNKWQHVAVVFTQTSVTFYYNGAQIPVSLITGNYGVTNLFNTSQPLRIAGYRAAGGNMALHFNGRIDELRGWNYALSALEVSSRMNTKLTGNEPGLVLYHELDGDFNNSAVSTGASNNGQVAAGTPFFMNSFDSYPGLFSLGNDTAMCGANNVPLDGTSLYANSYME